MREGKRKRAILRGAAARLTGAALLWLTLAPGLTAEGRKLTLAVPDELVETGFLKYLLPRFSLKYGIRITLAAPEAAAHASLTDAGAPDGVPAFSGDGRIWVLLPSESAVDDPDLARLGEWLGSDIGHQAIAGFKGAVAFAPAELVVAAPVETSLAGNAARGLDLSLRHCGRCHVVGEQNRMNGVGNTPSFPALRTFPDWEERFASFFALNPHPSFARVADLGPPAGQGHESAIAPVTLTLEELEDILSFVSGIAPADLGAPIRHQ